jgi:hypothetical protein
VLDFGPLLGPTFRAGFFVVALAIAARAQSITCTNATATPVTIRAEGLAEQVADASFTCNAPVGGGPYQLTAFLSLPITSVPLGSSGLSEATVVTSEGSVQGTVTGNAVTFANVPIPSGSSTVTLTNVRVNAGSYTSAGATVTESILAEANGLYSSVFNNLAVALVQPGLTAGTGGSETFAACANMTPASGPAFLIPVGENFSSAFKTQGGSSNNTLGSEFTANTETGYYVSVGGANNQATSGTRIRILFSGVPSGAMVYVPAVMTGGSATLVLTASELGPFLPLDPIPILEGHRQGRWSFRMAAGKRFMKLPRRTRW